MVVLVTGANGQVGQAIREVSEGATDLEFIFASSQELDVTNPESVENNFNTYKPDYCINAAAYTAVDKAESEPENAYKLNATAVEILAAACVRTNCTLIQISTDFVFDGTATSPYSESDRPNPLSVYGASKLAGEYNAAKCPKHFIIRTSWVYSKYGNNFFKTMLRLASEREKLTVVDDQRGTPTFAPDLALALIHIIRSQSSSYGTYHYSNLGEATWFEFAREIFVKNNVHTVLEPCETAAFPTAARRPAYSVMEKQKIMTTFNLSIRHWRDAIPG